MGESVPFTPDFFWAVHPTGHFLTGFSDEYRLNLGRDRGVLRIERDVERVPVSAAERDYHRERILRRMRSVDAAWSWDGPPIPDHKPFFAAVHAGRDGRIWVQLTAEGRPVDNQDHDPRDSRSLPVVWESPRRYDVFEGDGAYLGTVSSPDAFLTYPEPVFDEEHVWAVARGDLGVERVVRYRIVVGGV